jgi:hypothetical protein
MNPTRRFGHKNLRNASGGGWLSPKEAEVPQVTANRP